MKPTKYSKVCRAGSRCQVYRERPDPSKSGRNDAEVFDRGNLLIFPLPHGSAEAVDQDDRRALAHIEIGDALAIDLNGLDGYPLEWRRTREESEAETSRPASHDHRRAAERRYERLSASAGHVESPLIGYSSWMTVSSVFTLSPSATRMATTFPSIGAGTWLSIFMASMISRGSPAFDSLILLPPAL